MTNRKYQGREFTSTLQANSKAELDGLIKGMEDYSRKYGIGPLVVLQKRRDPDGGYEAVVKAHNWNPIEWIKGKLGGEREERPEEEEEERPVAPEPRAKAWGEGFTMYGEEGEIYEGVPKLLPPPEVPKEPPDWAGAFEEPVTALTLTEETAEETAEEEAEKKAWEEAEEGEFREMKEPWWKKAQEWTRGPYNEAWFKAKYEETWGPHPPTWEERSEAEKEAFRKAFLEEEHGRAKGKAKLEELKAEEEAAKKLEREYISEKGKTRVAELKAMQRKVGAGKYAAFKRGLKEAKGAGKETAGFLAGARKALIGTGYRKGMEMYQAKGMAGLTTPAGLAGMRGLTTPGKVGMRELTIPGRAGMRELTAPGRGGIRELSAPGRAGMKELTRPERVESGIGLEGMRELTVPKPRKVGLRVRAPGLSASPLAGRGLSMPRMGGQMAPGLRSPVEESPIVKLARGRSKKPNYYKLRLRQLGRQL